MLLLPSAGFGLFQTDVYDILQLSLRSVFDFSPRLFVKNDNFSSPRVNLF